MPKSSEIQREDASMHTSRVHIIRSNMSYLENAGVLKQRRTGRGATASRAAAVPPRAPAPPGHLAPPEQPILSPPLGTLLP